MPDIHEIKCPTCDSELRISHDNMRRRLMKAMYAAGLRGAVGLEIDQFSSVGIDWTLPAEKADIDQIVSFALAGER